MLVDASQDAGACQRLAPGAWCDRLVSRPEPLAARASLSDFQRPQRRQLAVCKGFGLLGQFFDVFARAHQDLIVLAQPLALLRDSIPGKFSPLARLTQPLLARQQEQLGEPAHRDSAAQHG